MWTTKQCALAGILTIAFSGCTGKTNGDEQADMASGDQQTMAHKIALPLVTPPVKAATPAGFSGSGAKASKLHPLTLSSSDFQSRFFSAGPTNIFNILGEIDGRIMGINQANADGSPKCFALTPVAYPLIGVGQNVTLYAQCYDQVGTGTPADPEFLQVGIKDGVTYLYEAIGQGQVAAIVTPVSADGGADGEGEIVEAWMSVGTLNAATSCGGHATWDGCSYGVIHLWANSASKQFEMTVAGIGFGYCGAQLRSDGSVIFGSGSTDMGMTCNDVDTLCVDAADAMTPASCPADVTAFTLGGLGRKAATGTSQTFGASAYPAAIAGVGNITLDGTLGDALHLGPTAPTSGTDRLR